MGDELTRFRRGFVSYHFQHGWDQVVDVGIGGGAFVEKTGCRGLDINPHAIVWLKERGLWGPGEKGVRAMTFWDSFEHIEDHDGYLKSVDWVFMSLPVFGSVEEVQRSKHFKPGEHIWYFTPEGLVAYMERYGFDLVDRCNNETKIGREGIMTYAFHRPGYALEV